MRIACLLIPHLAVQVERRRHPRLADKPVLLVTTQGSRVRVFDCSPGVNVAPGMPLAQALSLCPEAHVLEADPPAYWEAFDRVLRALLQRSPLVEAAEAGCAYVGLDGLEGLYGGDACLLHALLQAVPPYMQARVGAGPGKLPAYVAALKALPRGVCKAPEDVKGFLASVPVDLLPVSPEMKERLHAFGLHALGQVAALPLGPLQAQFGPEGRLAWELASGVDTRPLLPWKEEERVTASLAFSSPLASREALSSALETLVGRVFSDPALRGRCARSALLAGRVLCRGTWEKRVVFREPVGDRQRALSVLKGVLASAVLPGPLEELGLTLSGLTGQRGRQAGFLPEARAWEGLAEAIAQMEELFGGPPPLFVVREVEPWSRVPERRHALVPFVP